MLEPKIDSAADRQTVLDWDTNPHTPRLYLKPAPPLRLPRHGRAGLVITRGLWDLTVEGTRALDGQGLSTATGLSLQTLPVVYRPCTASANAEGIRLLHWDER